jgi:hypothetical protein
MFTKKYFIGANGLIGTTGTLLSDYFFGNILKIFSEKVFNKKFLKKFVLFC